MRRAFSPTVSPTAPRPTPLAVVDPTQRELPPLQLELEEPSAYYRIAGDTSRARSQDSGKVGTGGGQTTAAAADAGGANEMVSRAVVEALAWGKKGTQQGAEAALAVTGRLLAENPLSVEALQLRGVALHLLGR